MGLGGSLTNVAVSGRPPHMKFAFKEMLLSDLKKAEATEGELAACVKIPAYCSAADSHLSLH